jgi:sarcosine oxidase subunit beta
MASWEIVVIGGGVIGSSIAYHLARAGRQVLVVERAAPAVEPAASWASASGVRRQGRHPAEAPLAIEAIERWPALEEELGASLGYRQGGNLYVGEGEAEIEVVARFVRVQQENGFADVRLLDRRAALEIVPGLNEQASAASYSPRDGQADPPRTTRAFAGAAERHGAVYWNGTESLGLLATDSRVTGLRTSAGDVAAGDVVLAAGSWSDDLTASIGLRLPIRTRVPQILISTPARPGLVRPVLGSVSRRLSLKQLDDGSFMLGGGWPGVPSADRRSYTMDPASIEGGWATAAGLLPAVGEQRLAHRWCGLEARSLDGIPYIGPIRGLGGLTVATGFSGHGFALAPAVGRAVADLLAGRPTPELAVLSPDRIDVFDREAVERFLADQDGSDLGVG